MNDAQFISGIPVIGYFRRGPIQWLLTRINGDMLTGFEITPKGKIHTMHMHRDSAEVIVMIDNQEITEQGHE